MTTGSAKESFHMTFRRQGIRLSRLLKQLARLHAIIPPSPFLAQYARGTRFMVKLWRHRIPRRWNHTHDPVSQMKVAQVMTTQILTVPTTMELAELACVFE